MAGHKSENPERRGEDFWYEAARRRERNGESVTALLFRNESFFARERRQEFEIETAKYPAAMAA